MNYNDTSMTLIKRSKLESKYFHYSTLESGSKYEKEKNICSKLLNREEKVSFKSEIKCH